MATTTRNRTHMDWIFWLIGTLLVLAAFYFAYSSRNYRGITDDMTRTEQNG